MARMNHMNTIFNGKRDDTAHQRFLVFFLHDDSDLSVWIEDTADIDFSEVISHLHFGGSVFITPRNHEYTTALDSAPSLEKGV
jgi:hypothetical protein